MPAPTVHYLWVGPHPLLINAGQDTVGPDLMRQKYPTDDQPIVFWCLDSEIDYYIDHFNKAHPGRTPVKVKGIETYAHSLPPIPFEGSDLKQDFLDLMEKLKERAAQFPEKKDQIREWITLKEIFSYFVQLNESGFVTDSNCRPDGFDETQSQDRIKPLQPLEGFHCTFYPGNTGRPDPWLMYMDRSSDGLIETAKSRFKVYATKVKKYLAACEDDDNYIPMENVKGERGLSIRGWIATQWCHVALATATPIQTKEPKSHSKLRDSVQTPVGFIKRLHGSHYTKHHLEKTTLLERILVGDDSPQEFYYYAKRHPFDPFASFNCRAVRKDDFTDKTSLKKLDKEIDEIQQEVFELKMGYSGEGLTEEEQDARLASLDAELQQKFEEHEETERRIKQDLQARFPDPITMAQLAIGLGKYHDLATMMALSHDSRVVPTLLSSPRESGCLDIYCRRLCDIHQLAPEILFQQMKEVLSITNQLYPALPQSELPETMTALIALIQTKNATSAHKCLELFATLGPLIDEDIMKRHLRQLKTWHHDEKRPPTPTHFHAEAGSRFNKQEAEERLINFISPGHDERLHK